MAVDGDLATFNHTASTTPGAAWELHFPSERPLALVEIAIVDSGPLTTFSATLPAGTVARDLRIGFEPDQAAIVHLAEVRDFSYDDTAPWPTSPDGVGPSLVLIAPASRPDHALPENWRAGAANPGTSDATTFSGGDSAALLAYAAGPSSASRLADGNIAFTVEINPRADDMLGELEISTDLLGWSPGGTLFTRTYGEQTPVGRARITFTTQTPPGGPSFFLRYAVTPRDAAP